MSIFLILQIGFLHFRTDKALDHYLIFGIYHFVLSGLGNGSHLSVLLLDRRKLSWFKSKNWPTLFSLEPWQGHIHHLSDMLFLKHGLNLLLRLLVVSVILIHRYIQRRLKGRVPCLDKDLWSIEGYWTCSVYFKLSCLDLFDWTELLNVPLVQFPFTRFSGFIQCMVVIEVSSVFRLLVLLSINPIWFIPKPLLNHVQLLRVIWLLLSQSQLVFDLAFNIIKHLQIYKSLALESSSHYIWDNANSCVVIPILLGQLEYQLFLNSSSSIWHLWLPILINQVLQWIPNLCSIRLIACNRLCVQQQIRSKLLGTILGSKLVLKEDWGFLTLVHMVMHYFLSLHFLL